MFTATRHSCLILIPDTSIITKRRLQGPSHTSRLYTYFSNQDLWHGYIVNKTFMCCLCLKSPSYHILISHVTFCHQKKILGNKRLILFPYNSIDHYHTRHNGPCFINYVGRYGLHDHQAYYWYYLLALENWSTISG